jgi:hypothetical protein
LTSGQLTGFTTKLLTFSTGALLCHSLLMLVDIYLAA